MVGISVLDLFKIIGEEVLKIVETLDLNTSTADTIIGLGFGMLITLELGVATGVLINKCCKPKEAHKEGDENSHSLLTLGADLYQDGDSPEGDTPDGYDSDPVITNVTDTYEKLAENRFKI